MRVMAAATVAWLNIKKLYILEPTFPEVMDSSTLVEVKGVFLRYGSNRVLQGLDMDINRGEIFGITGVSGSGKSTLLNLLSGLLMPDAGTICYSQILLGEKNIKPLDLKHNKRLIRNFIGFSTQDPSFYEELTIAENLDFFGTMYSVPREIRKRNIDSLIEVMGLKDARNRTAKSLSGGMRKRLDIAIAMIHNPKILFLDEPTSDLDPILRNKMWALLKLVNQKGMTVVVSSHFLNEIEELCSTIGILHKGKIIRLIQKKVGSFVDEWVEVVAEPKNYEALVGELLKKGSLKPEEINLDRGRLLIKGTEKGLKEILVPPAKALGLTSLRVKTTSQTLDEIFKKTVE